MTKIRVAWINDTVGSLGRTRGEEVAYGLPHLSKGLGFKLDLVVSGPHMGQVGDKKIDLLVFDYGGAANSYGEFLWDQFDAMIKWAQEHEGSLVLLYSSMTSQMYQNLLKSEVGDQYRSENILLWHSSNSGAIEKDIELQRKVCAWFVGGDWEPYEYEQVKPKPHARLKSPGRQV